MGSTSPRSSKDRRRRIGVFIGRVDDSYQRDIWRSIVRRASERGVEVIGFFGHGLGAPVASQAAMNVVYRMASPRNLDGLVVLSNTVGNFEEPSSVSSLVAERSLPTISIQYELEGLPCVSARGGSAMAELVRHLVRKHGRRSFALVTGPRNHIDSQEREAAFRKTLEEEGLKFDERLLFQGKFFTESGSEAVRSFFESGAKFDAIVCLNDYMALGAIEALRARGITIPSEVSVTGFDDIGEARWATPPLTTVHQPRQEMGRTALDMALELLGGNVPSAHSLDCHCVYRQSCGCPPDLPLSDSTLSLPEGLDSQTLGRLGSIKLLAERDDAQGILRVLDEALLHEPGNSGTLSLWRRLLYGVHSDCPSQASRPGMIAWFDQAIAFLGEVEQRWEVERRIKTAERYALVRELIVSLLGTFSFDALVRQWESCIGRAGISRGYFVLFDGPVERGGGKAPARSKLVEAIPPPGRGVAYREFPTELLLPTDKDFVWCTAGWIIEPLVYQDEPLGYLLLECGSEDPIIYETLREEMSTACKGTLLMEEIKRNKDSLERLVDKRTSELRAANRDLKKEIDERRILEREVQEVSNRTMQTIGQDLHDDLCQHLVGISMLTAVVEETLTTTGSVSVDSIREIRDLLEKAVSRSRQFARTLYPPGLEAMGLVPALEDLVGSLGRAGGASLSFQVEGDCRVEDPRKALQLYRIVQEALTNALRHSGSNDVILRLFRKDGPIVAEVRDFGHGLGTEYIGRGMGMRIMRYRADSIGARLEIHNLDPGVCVLCAIEP
jgi:DNA-binding LacI/PurR family transcriptional regulator/signal transduction histidine kinase